jgi:hypothetical protein
MPSNAALATAIIAFLGFFINGVVTFLVLSRGRQRYHYLFAASLFAHAVWDIGIFLIMIRNSFVNEVIIYGNVVMAFCIFLPALIYHFTCSYLNQPRKKLTIFIWAFCACMFIGRLAGIGGRMGIHYFSWGNFPFNFTPFGLYCFSIWLALSYVFIWSACWFLFRARHRETSPVTRRHMLYILISLLVVSLAFEKTFVNFGIDNPYMVPAGILFTDIFGALIGIAIIKERLFDITFIIKKGTIYSALVAIIIFVFSCSEHLLSKYLGDLLGEQPIYVHLISIAIVVGVLMPVRRRLERRIEGFFVQKKIEF